MALTGGDRKFGHGDELTVTNAHGSTVSEGQLVYISGYDAAEDRPEVSLADDSTGYDGVVKLTRGSGGAADGDALTMIVQGTPMVLVGSSGAVVAGEAPAGSGTAGTATNGGSGEDVYLSDPVQLKDGNYYAAVHLG